MKIACLALFAVITLAGSARADDPVIVDVAVENAGRVWTIDVTLAHPDSGWDHYADGWEVLDAAGNRLGFRKLLHPHVAEQPFTRSLGGVVIGDETRAIFIRPHCSRDGWADKALRVELPR